MKTERLRIIRELTKRSDRLSHALISDWKEGRCPSDLLNDSIEVDKKLKAVRQEYVLLYKEQPS